MSGRLNNFDGIRLIAAVAVLFTHAFVVAEGGQQNEPFVRLTDNQCPIGLIGVFAFFCISGYLVTQSYVSTASGSRFAVKRALRILPGLLVSLLICAFVIGPVVTTLSFPAYFSDHRLSQFLVRNALLDLGDHPLPGVLFSANSAGDTINGSLWTLRYEVMMYAMVIGLGALRLLRLPIAVGLLALGIVAILFEQKLDPFGDLGEWAWLVGFFAGGMCLYFVRDHRWYGWPAALLAVAGLVASDRMHLLIPLFPLFGGVLTIWLAVRYTPLLRPLRRFGDLSYGTYIYGWPVEQCVVRGYGGNATWWQVFLWSLPITLGIAWLSWHGVEKWAIRLGHRAQRLHYPGTAANARRLAT